MPAKTSGTPDSAYALTSAGDTAVTIALFAFEPSRLLKLMPLTARWPGSEEAFTTKPPGHIQKEYMPLPSSGVTATR